MSYIPSTPGGSAFVSASVREIHVGDVPNAYATMELALAAVAALAPPASTTNPVNVIVHPGERTPTSGSWQIHAGVSIIGIDGGSVGFYGALDIFDIQGDGVFFSNFHVKASDAPTTSIFKCNDHSFINISNVGLWINGSNVQRYLTQSGSNWHQMSVGNSLIDSSVVTGYACYFINTGPAARYVDVEIDSLFSDTWIANGGGSFLIQGCQDFRFMNSKIRSSLNGYGITLQPGGTSGTSWIELFSVTSVKEDGGYGPLLIATANTDVRWAFCDGTYTTAGTITIVGGSTTPGPPGPVGPQGPGGPAVGLTTAYDLDLSTLAPASYSSDGTKVIDGRNAWRLTNSVNGQLIALNDGTHPGLYTRCSTFASVNYTATYNGPRWTVGLNDLCGLNPRDCLEQWVFFMFSEPHTPNQNYETGYCAISALPGADTDTDHSTPLFNLARGYTGGGVNPFIMWQKTATTTVSPAGVTPPAASDDVYAFRILANSVIEAYTGVSVAGAWPTMANMRYVGSALYFTQTQGFDIDNAILNTNFQWAAVMSVASSNTAGAADFLLKKIKVLYR